MRGFGGTHLRQLSGHIVAQEMACHQDVHVISEIYQCVQCQELRANVLMALAYRLGGGIDLDNISDEVNGQGHRSKDKFARLKKMN